MDEPPRTTQGLRSVLRYLPRYRQALVAGAVTLVVGQLLVAYAPQVLRRALTALEPVAAVDVAAARATAGRLALVYVGVVLLQGVLSFLSRRLLVGASRCFERDLKRDVFGRLVSLPLGFFDR